ncbi:hypothetical protein ACFLU4_06025 [Chloroflexota bacterium]
MSKDLRQFLKSVKEAGPGFYVEVKKPLSAEYEVSVLSEKLVKEGHSPVVYCPEIKGSKLPLVFGSIGSYELLGLAFDITPEKLKAAGIGTILEEYRGRRANLRPTKDVWTNWKSPRRPWQTYSRRRLS